MSRAFTTSRVARRRLAAEATRIGSSVTASTITTAASV